MHFVLPHNAHFDNMIALPLLLLEIYGSMFSVSFLHFKQYDFIFILTYLVTGIINNFIILKHYS